MLRPSWGFAKSPNRVPKTNRSTQQHQTSQNQQTQHPTTQTTERTHGVNLAITKAPDTTVEHEPTREVYPPAQYSATPSLSPSHLPARRPAPSGASSIPPRPDSRMSSQETGFPPCHSHGGRNPNRLFSILRAGPGLPRDKALRRASAQPYQYCGFKRRVHLSRSLGPHSCLRESILALARRTRSSYVNISDSSVLLPGRNSLHRRPKLRTATYYDAYLWFVGHQSILLMEPLSVAYLIKVVLVFRQLA